MSFDLDKCVEEAFRRCFPDMQISPDSDFFDLGGDSLKAVELCLLLTKAIKTEVHPSVLFLHPTPAAITQTLRG